MYDIIEAMIGHTWQSQYTSDQQYIYYIAGAVIIIFLVMIYDLIGRFIEYFRFK